MPNPYCQPIGSMGLVYLPTFTHLPYKSTIHGSVIYTSSMDPYKMKEFQHSFQGGWTHVTHGKSTNKSHESRDRSGGCALRLGKTTSKLMSTAFQKNAIDLQNLLFLCVFDSLRTVDGWLKSHSQPLTWHLWKKWCKLMGLPTYQTCPQLVRWSDLTGFLNQPTIQQGRSGRSG